MSAWPAIRWELSCVGIELSVAALGLWLMLGTSLTELGSLVMFGLCVVSFAVRLRHYSTTSLPQNSSSIMDIG